MILIQITKNWPGGVRVGGIFARTPIYSTAALGKAEILGVRVGNDPLRRTYFCLRHRFGRSVCHCIANGENVVLSARNRATNGSDPYPGAAAPHWAVALPLFMSVDYPQA